jgi:hypothetical protein
MGLADEPSFGRYHEVLSQARWDARAVARRLLLHVLDRLLPNGPVVIEVDDTIERRWGAKLTWPRHKRAIRLAYRSWMIRSFSVSKIFVAAAVR